MRLIYGVSKNEEFEYFAIVFLVGLFLFGAGNLAETLAQRKSAVVEVPMSFSGTRPVIEVMINSKGPFRFLVDTGAGGMARADVSLVERLGLSVVGEESSSDAGNKTKGILNKVKFDTLSIKDLQFRDVTAYSRNYNTSTYLSHIDGILGFDIFADYLLTLDYSNRKVRIEHGALPKADGKQILNFQMIQGNPAIDIFIGDIKTSALIDSGNIRAVDLSSEFLKKIPLVSSPRTIGRGGGVSGEYDLKEVQLQETLSIGAFSFPEPSVTFSDVFDEVNIGSSLLRKFRVTFDQKNRRIRFEKAKRF